MPLSVAEELVTLVAGLVVTAGGPVVVKGCTAEASHKTELGLVKVGPDSEAAVTQACEAMMAPAATAGVATSTAVVSDTG